MGAPKTRQQMADELNRQLDERFQELEELNQALDAILDRQLDARLRKLNELNQRLEAILNRRRRKRWRRSPLDPFTHLERFFEKLLDRVERAVSRKR